MTLVGYDNDAKQEYYKYEIPEYVTGFIISGIKDDGSKERDQTPDLTASDAYDGIVYSMEYVNGNTVKILGNFDNYKAKLDDYIKIYLKPNSNWTQSNARFAAYVWTSANTWIDMKDADGDGYYSCWVPETYKNIIFCRMNPSSTTNGWTQDTQKWNQTGDLTIPTNGNNCYTVKDGTWDKGGGSWSKYNP